jgi:hypothetical protein
MSQVAPPLCLVLGLAMLVAGFALLTVEAPSEPMELHQARVTGDDAYRDVLEAGVARRRLIRKTLIGSLFLGSGLMVLLAFLAMAPAGNPVPSTAYDPAEPDARHGTD